MSMGSSFTKWRRLPHRQLAMAKIRALAGHVRLPPGSLLRLDELERSDRRILQKLGQKHGPIFKGVIDNRLAVCVIGNQAARRLLRENSSAVKPVTIDVSRLFPGEFMRGMGGAAHKTYRSALIKALGMIDLDALESSMRLTVNDGLSSFTRSNADPRKHFDIYRRWSDALSTISSGMLIQFVFGAARGSDLFDQLMDGYHELGPKGVVWNIDSRQVAAYARLRGRLGEDMPRDDIPNLFSMISAQGHVDDTMLGNLIYMVETGRYDLRGLFRWIAKYGAEHPEWMHQIATADCGHRKVLTEAFVLEVLRLDQSERLMRDVLHDFAFDGFLIPKGALLRLCMWESHKDATTFGEPFVFDPGRFLNGKSYGEKFSPFGLDQHRCPLADVSIWLASTFLAELACNFDISASGGEPAVRGPYHWEPSPDFEIALAPGRVDD